MSIRVLAPAVLALALSSGALRAQTPGAAPTQRTDSMSVVRGTSVKWGPLEVPGFKPGLELGVLAGDPGKPAPYTVRLRFPAGYVFPAHYHPNAENITVISGRFLLGMGEQSDGKKQKTYAPGDYLYIPAEMPHFGRVEGPTIVQLHGMGPFEVKLVQPPVGASAP
jgi:quercetin dioxygenase-like cupin family protein